MPAPSPVSFSAPVAPRCSRLQRTPSALTTMSCEGRPLMSTTNPKPQESCSSAGSYRPCAGGNPASAAMFILVPGASKTPKFVVQRSSGPNATVFWRSAATGPAEADKNVGKSLGASRLRITPSGARELPDQRQDRLAGRHRNRGQVGHFHDRSEKRVDLHRPPLLQV